MTPVYETDRLLLTFLDKHDADKVLSFYIENQQTFEPWEPTREKNFYTLAYQKAFLTAEKNLIAAGKLLRYWVMKKDNPDEILGCVCFQNILREPYHNCSMGYKFSLAHQHQGYAIESITKCIEIVFGEHNLHRIEAYIMENNEPSLRLIKRLHFYYEGLSCSYARIASRWTDHRRYALINATEHNYK